MSETKHTPEAIKAAQAIHRDGYLDEKFMRNQMMQEPPGRVAEIIDRETKLPQMVELLEELSEYFDGRADVVDGDMGEQRPNEEMSLKHRIDLVLGKEVEGF